MSECLSELGRRGPHHLDKVDLAALEIEPSGADARDIQEPVEQDPKAVGRLTYESDVAPDGLEIDLRMTQPALGELQPREDRREGRAELVRRDRDELVAEPHRLLDHLLLRGDVTRDRRCADDLALLVADGGDGHRNGDPLPILVHANGLVVVDALAPAEALEDGRQLVGMVGWYEDRDRASDHFFGAVAVNALGTGVPADDRAVERLTDDRVVRRIDDRRQVLRRPGRQRAHRLARFYLHTGAR